MIGVEGIVADVSGRHAKDRYSGGGGYLSFQSVEVSVNRSGLPTGVGEYRVVDLGEDTSGREGEEGAGLDSRAEGEGAELGLIGNGSVLG